MDAILSRLNNNNGINYYIDKSQWHASNTQENCHNKGILYIEDIDWYHGDELEETHDDDVWFSVCSADWYVIWGQTIYDFDWPWKPNHSCIPCHQSWIELEILLKQILHSQKNHTPESLINVLSDEQIHGSDTEVLSNFSRTSSQKSLYGIQLLLPLIVSIF